MYRYIRAQNLLYTITKTAAPKKKEKKEKENEKNKKSTEYWKPTQWENIYGLKIVSNTILKDTSLFFTTSMNFYFFPLYKTLFRAHIQWCSNIHPNITQTPKHPNFCVSQFELKIIKKKNSNQNKLSWFLKEYKI